jgi:hypothetical protein
MRLFLLALLSVTFLSMGATARLQCTGLLPPFIVVVQPEDEDDLGDKIEEEIEEIF